MTDLSQEVRDPAKRAEWLIVAQRFGFMCPTTASRLVAALGEIDRLSGGPRRVCLCGSTRFYEAFQRANYEETMAGRIVLSVGFYPDAKKRPHCEELGCTPEQKIAVDTLHMRKIDLADEVLVLNVGGYIGESTRRELDYASEKRQTWATAALRVRP